MVQNNNSELSRRLSNAVKLQQTEGVPSQVSNQIVPTVEVNPIPKHANRAGQGTSAVTGTTTIFTCPSNKDFYLCSAHMSMYDDATSDNVATYLTVTLNNGNSVRIFDIRKPTTTAYGNTQALAFPYPIKLQRGSTITVTNSFTVGSSTKTGNITGIELE